MKTNHTTRKLIAGITLVAGIAGLGAGAAGAQTTQTTPATASASAGQHGPGRGHRGGPGAMHGQVLASLVKAGTITQAKADAVVKAFEAARPQKPAIGSNPGSTPATPRADRPDPVTAHKAVLDSLVKAGTITQAEADAILKSITDARPMGAQGTGRPIGGKAGMPGGMAGGRGGRH